MSELKPGFWLDKQENLCHWYRDTLTRWYKTDAYIHPADRDAAVAALDALIAEDSRTIVPLTDGYRIVVEQDVERVEWQDGFTGEWKRVTVAPLIILAAYHAGKEAGK